MIAPAEARRVRLGYLTHVPGDVPARAFRETIELAVEAERLGLDSFRVAQHHDGHLGGLLPSPLVLLAAVVQHTAREVVADDVRDLKEFRCRPRRSRWSTSDSSRSARSTATIPARGTSTCWR